MYITNRYRGFTYVVAVRLLLLVKLGVELVDTWTVRVGVTSEGDIQALQELVASGEQRLWLLSTRLDGWLTVKDNDTVGKVGGHDEIVLDDEGGLLRVHDETLDDPGGNDTLLGVEVCRRLIDQVDIGWDTQGQDNGNTLQLTTRQVLDLLVDEVVHLQWLVDIGLELRAQEGGLDLLEEQLAHGTLELWHDLLGLHADVHLRHLLVVIRLNRTCKHLTESGLSGTVLSHHDNDLGVSELAGLDGQVEVAESLGHLRVGVVTVSIRKEVFASLADTELQRLFTETQVLRWNVTVQELVDTLADGCWKGDDTIDGWPSVKKTDVVREVVQNRQIVLDDDNVAVGAEERADETTSGKTLLDIEEGRWLVEHVNIGFLDADDGDGETLQLTTRKKVNVTVHDVLQLKSLDDLLQPLLLDLAPLLEQVANGPLCALDGLWDLVDILRLHDGLEIVLQNFGEVVLQLGTTEVL